MCYERTGQRNIMTQIKRRRLEWLCLIRKDPESFTRQALKLTPGDGGKPKENWIRTIEKETKSMKKSWGGVELTAKTEGNG